jgi:hypothetical protein
MVIYVYNATGVTIDVYAPLNSGSKINALTTSSPYLLSTVTGARFVAASTTQWYTI